MSGQGAVAPALRKVRACAVGAGLSLFAVGVFAQQEPERSRHIGAGYAQLINITLSEDLSAARYVIEGEEGIADAPLQIVRLPWRFASTSLGKGSLDWRLEAGYLRLETEFEFDLASLGSAGIESRWKAYGASVGARYRYPITGALSLEPTLWLGAARLENDAVYNGFFQATRQVLDGVLFNWETWASIVTADLGLVWQGTWGSVGTELGGRATYSHMDSFGESSEAVSFREAGNTLSLRAGFEGATGGALGGRDLLWTATASYGRFFGDNHDTMGFNNIVELGAGLALATSPTSRFGRPSLRASVLRGTDVYGWSVGVSLSGN